MLWGFKTNPTLPNTLDFGLVVCRKSFRFVYKLYKYSPKFSKKKKKKNTSFGRGISGQINKGFGFSFFLSLFFVCIYF
jgi:hypothetical protein